MFEKEKDFLFGLSNKKLLLVHGKGSFVGSGAKEWLKSVYNKNKVISFSEFQVNPEVLDLERGIELFNKSLPDYVLAIGGGSVLDMAKMIRFFATQHIEPGTWLDGTNSREIDLDCSVPLVAIPTTAGTGAEATHFAVLYKDKVKYSVAHSLVLPDKVILAPQLSMAMSPFLTAVTGLDAFFQAVESWWSKGANDESRGYSEKAIALILKSLKSSVHNGDIESRSIMLEASYWAGKAINIAKTTACHAFSYVLTSKFGLPHGQAVAVTFPFILDFNLSKMRQEESLVLRSLLRLKDESPLKWGGEFIRDISVDFKVPVSKEELYLIFTKNVNLERLKNNPVEIDNDVIKQLAVYCVTG